MKDILWEDIKLGDKFLDGSCVSEIHDTKELETIKLFYHNLSTKDSLFNRAIKYPILKSFLKLLDLTNMGKSQLYKKVSKYTKKYDEQDIILSSDHLLLCNIKELPEDVKNLIKNFYSNVSIPKIVDVHLHAETEELQKELDENIVSILEYFSHGNCKNIKYIEELISKLNYKEEFIESDKFIKSENEIWLNAFSIMQLVRNGFKLYCNDMKFSNALFYGRKECFCISTDSGQYHTNDLIHHNSVTLRDIIFHCLTHSNKISIALVDLKLTEFTRYKKFKDVLGVANTVEEAAELLRIGRTIMYKRNGDLAKHDLNDFTKFRPKQPTDVYWVSGRTLNGSDMIKVRIDGQETEIPVSKLHEFVNTF